MAARKIRSEVAGRLSQAAQQAVTDGLLFHQAVAERLNLSVSDLRALRILFEPGLHSAGEIGDRTGLTTGAVTRMIDRLEQAGYVRRRADSEDRRRVYVEPINARAAEVATLYRGLAEGWTEALSDRDSAELESLISILDRMGEVTRKEIQHMRSQATRRRQDVKGRSR